MSLLKILIKHNNTAILDRIFIMVIIYIPKYDWYKKMIEKKMRNNQEDAERMSF